MADDGVPRQERDKDAHEGTVKKVISQSFNVACRAKQDTFNVGGSSAAGRIRLHGAFPGHDADPVRD